MSVQLIRDDPELQAWRIGEVEIWRQENRIGILYGERLNVSFPESAFKFHAGTKADLFDALRSLSVVLPSGVLAGLAPGASAISKPVNTPKSSVNTDRHAPVT